MTSKTHPTAVEEIQSRIDTLENQIEQSLRWASEAQDQAKEHNDTAARLALLRTQYKRVIEVRPGIGDSIMVHGIVGRLA